MGKWAGPHMGKEFHFHSTGNGKPFDGFTQRSDIICLTFEQGTKQDSHSSGLAGQVTDSFSEETKFRERGSCSG